MSRWLELARAAVPLLTNGVHKGQAGRVAVVGGSLEYTGAPYFAAISALKVGADLVHVFCTKDAAPVIKSYSPELIVHPLLNINNGVEEIKTWLERIHVVVVGPGLGRDPGVMRTVTEIINYCKDNRKPLIIDADGLHLITENINIIQNYPSPGVILTPNKVEFDRLYKVIKVCGGSKDHDEINIDFNRLGNNVLILQKGRRDQTYCATPDYQWSNDIGGSGRRCGGQGDLLSGSMATFFYWSINNLEPKNTMLSASVASYAAALLTRNCNEKAFSVKGRSMVCSDMIEKIHDVFDNKFEKK